MIEILVYMGVPLVLLILGLVIGGAVESAHFRKLAEQEQALSSILISDLKQLPSNWKPSLPVLVTGEAVIATDYFKVWVAGVRKLFGGHVPGFERLMERARREAIVRMLHQAQQARANVVWNVRLETSTIQGKRQGKSGGVEVLAYGTAMQVTSK